MGPRPAGMVGARMAVAPGHDGSRGVDSIAAELTAAHEAATAVAPTLRRELPPEVRFVLGKTAITIQTDTNAVR